MREIEGDGVIWRSYEFVRADWINLDGGDWAVALNEYDPSIVYVAHNHEGTYCPVATYFSKGMLWRNQVCEKCPQNGATENIRTLIALLSW